jgi:hypothetical protein
MEGKVRKSMIRARLIKAEEIVTREPYRNCEGDGEALDRSERAVSQETPALPPGSKGRVTEIVSEWARKKKGNAPQTDARALFASLFSTVSD